MIREILTYIADKEILTQKSEEVIEINDEIKHIDVAFAIIAIIAMYEYKKCVSNKSKIIGWISYLAVASIAIIHLLPKSLVQLILYCFYVYLRVLFMELDLTSILYLPFVEYMNIH